MLASKRVFALASVLAIVSPACNGTKPSPAPLPEFEPLVSGLAGFVDIGRDEAEVELRLRGTHSHPASDPAKLRSIDLYGAPGRLGKDQLGTPATLLLQLSGEELGDRAWEIVPTSPVKYSLPAIGGKLEDFSVLLRFTYDGKSGTQVLDRAGMFSSWAPMARAIDLKVPDPNPGDTITLMTGSGTFWGAQGIAMYDFTVNFDGTATKIEAYAARADAPGWPASYHKIYSEEFTHLSGPWTVTGAIGRYNSAYDEYWLQVQVTADDGSGVSAVHTKTGSYTDIIANQGSLIDMVE